MLRLIHVLLPVASLVFAVCASAQESRYIDALRKAKVKDYDSALRGLIDLIREAPSFDRAYRALAAVGLQAGRVRELRAELERKIREDAQSPYRHYALSELWLAEGDFRAAEDAAWRAVGISPGFVPAYDTWVRAKRGQGRVGEAERLLLDAVAKNALNPAVHHALGVCMLFQRKPKEAARYFEDTLRLRPDLFLSLYGLHMARYESQDYKGTLAVLAQMAALASDGDLDWQYYIAGRKGVVHKDIGNYRIALPMLEFASSTARELGDSQRQIHFQANLATVYGHVGEYERAFSASDEVLRLARTAGDRLAEGRIHGQQARFHSARSEYTSAIQSFQQAIDIARQVKDRASEADQLRGFAEILAYSGKPAAALEIIATAIQIARDRKNAWLEARYLLTKAAIQRELLQFREAADTCRQVEQLAAGDKYAEADAALRAGELQLMAGRRTEALADLLRALNLTREAQSRVLEAHSLNMLGRLRSEQRLEVEAMSFYTSALALGNEIHSPAVLFQAHGGLALLYHKSGRLQDALYHCRSSVEALEKMRAGFARAEDRAAFVMGKLDVYRQVVSLLATLHRQKPRRGYDVEAFHYAERGHARSYLQMIIESRGDRGAELDGGSDETGRELRGRIANIQARLVDAYSSVQQRSGISALQQELAKADETYDLFLWQKGGQRRAGMLNPEPLPVSAVQRRLGSRRLLLEYSIGRHGSFLFAVTSDRLRIYRLPAASALERDVETLRAAIGKGPSSIGFSNFMVTARKLYGILVEPASSLFGGKTELVIVPDGILSYLPFEVLLSEMPSVATASDVGGLAYLIRDHAVSYVPSVSVLAALEDAAAQRSPASTEMLLAYGDPNYGKDRGVEAPKRSFFEGPEWSVGRLPHSRREVEKIAKLFPSSQVTVRTGSRATETSLKQDSHLSTYGVLHFAVHGMIHKSRPQLSGLALSFPDRLGGEKQEDGLLQVYEIVKLKLNAGLVVLSACETGLGKEVPGEGLVGPAQAFLYAGADAVAVSLWKVEDASTAALMYEFYRRKRSIANMAQALRQAKLQQIRTRTYAHPYYWAGFVLVGRNSRFVTKGTQRY